MVQIIVRPVLASCSIIRTTENAVVLSSPEVGSSRNSRGGSFSSSRATASRFRCPPERLDAFTSWCLSSPIDFMTCDSSNGRE